MSEDAKNGLRYQEVWRGQYRGVGLEIRRWSYGEKVKDILPDPVWNYYIYIPLDKVPQNSRKQFLATSVKSEFRRYWNYNKTILADLGWHGGMTWYDKHGGTNGMPIIIEVGCDYAHSWDTGHTYTVDCVLADCKRTIDDLLERVPELGDSPKKDSQ